MLVLPEFYNFRRPFDNTHLEATKNGWCTHGFPHLILTATDRRRDITNIPPERFRVVAPRNSVSLESAVHVCEVRYKIKWILLNAQYMTQWGHSWLPFKQEQYFLLDILSTTCNWVHCSNNITKHMFYRWSVLSRRPKWSRTSGSPTSSLCSSWGAH